MMGIELSPSQLALLAECDQKLGINPKDIQALNNRGNLLHDLGRINESLASFAKAIAIAPDYKLAWFNQGCVLQDLKEFSKAMACYEQVLRLDPTYLPAFNNQGFILTASEDYSKALAIYDQAIQLHPHDAKLCNSRAVLLHRLARYKEAIANYDAALSIDPNDTDVKVNKSLAHLVLGEFKEGWPQYEARWNSSQLKEAYRHFSAPVWLGQADLRGKTILLWPEQGFGDTLQFCRYARVISSLGAKVILQTSPDLLRLFQASFEPLGITVLSENEPVPPLDFHSPLLSLPLACQTNREESIPHGSSYLRAPDLYDAKWGEMVGTSNARRVGFVWAGGVRVDNSAAQTADTFRSLKLADILPLIAQASSKNCVFYSLQKGERSSELTPSLCHDRGIIDLTAYIHDWADTAAFIQHLDLVITCDTSVAHLAAALGKPTWIAIPFNGCWRWLVNRTDNPWYPTVRLFRQKELSRWDLVIQEIAQAL